MAKAKKKGKVFKIHPAQKKILGAIDKGVKFHYGGAWFLEPKKRGADGLSHKN